MITNSLLILCGIILLGLVTALLVLFMFNIYLERQRIKLEALKERLKPW